MFSVALMFAMTSAWAQYFQFSQYNLTPQRINPASVASTDYARLDFVYRNQATEGGFRLNSNSLNASYPLQSRRGRRWAGVGLSLLDDRSGKAGIFATQEAAIAYAINVDVAPDQSLSLGVKVLYQNRRIDLNGLYTGAQYIPDRGFDETLSPGENFGDLKNDYLTFSAGLHWHKADKEGTFIAYWDLSFFDLNRPDEHFIEASPLNPTLVAAGGLRVYHEGNMSIFPTVLYTRSSANNIVNTGAVFRCDLDTKGNEPRPHVDLITSYVFGRSGIVGMQFHNDRFGVGVSYDFPLFSRNVANTGAVEVGLVLKKRVIRNARERTSRGRPLPESARSPGKRLGASVGVKTPAATRTAPTDSVKTATDADRSMSARLRQKQDSIAAQGIAGMVRHEPLVLERATLRFNFGFNSTLPGDDAVAYMDELAGALQDNPELRLQLTGHTDNVGSDRFNLRLSLARAQAMKDYLVERGISASRITVDGKGMREPLNGNASPEEQAQNRRVEMTILFEH